MQFPYATIVLGFMSGETARMARAIASVALVLSLYCTGPVSAQRTAATLTRRDIATLAADAPASRVAAFEAAVSRAAAGAAGTLSLDNPVLSGMGGVRWNPDGSRPFSMQANVSLPLDILGQRGTRIDAADAEYRAAKSVAARDTRRAILLALLQHALVLKDARLAELAAARHALSERVLAAAQSRFKAGTVPELDVALTSLQEKRDAADEASARGDYDADKVALFAFLGTAESASVGGDIVPSGDVPPMAGVLEQIDQNVDVQAAKSASLAARAGADRAAAAGRPTVSVIAQYERDDAANIGLIGLSIPIPILNANRSAVATSDAEVATSKARFEQSRLSAVGQMRSLYARYESTRRALDRLLPTAELAVRAVTLATRGYEVGEDDLAGVLLVRRESLDAQIALLQAQHAHAVVKLELLVSSGRFPQ